MIKNGTNTDTVSGIVTIANLTFNNNAGTSIISGSSNTVSVTKALTVSGALTTNENLILTSNANGTARVAESYGSISGVVTVQRYIPARRAWRLLTAPLRGNGVSLTLNSAWQTNNSTGVLLFAPSGANGFTAGGAAPNIRQYIAGTGWLNLTGTSTNNILDADAGGTTSKNKAYVVFVIGPSNSTNIVSGANITTIKTTGKMITGQQDFTISATNNHFNLIGNPYASPVDLELFYTANSSNIGTAFYIWDAQLSSYGSYITATRTGVNTFTYAPNNATEYRYIQSGQAFFATSNGGGSNVSFQESHKVANGITTLFRGGASQNLSVNISFKNPDNSWQLADGFTTIYDNSYSADITDEFDAEKFINSHKTVSLLRNNKKLAMEARPLMATNDTMFINMAQMRQLNYKFDFNPSNLQAAGLQAFLQDAFTNTQTAISLTSISNYEFIITADVASFAENRFRILFKPVVPLPVNINKIKAYQKQNGVQIEWIVSNEINIGQYIVEKANASLSFEKIETVVPKGSAISETSYSVFDSKPFLGVNYFRVKAIDKNGEFKYSETVKVNIGKGKESITIFPNPSTGNQIFIILNNLNIGKYELKVSNLLAQEILHTSINYSGNNNQLIINTTNWATRVYNLLLFGKNLQLQQKVIKQ